MVSFTPTISGTWYWAEDDTILIFAPETFWQAGKAYTWTSAQARRTVRGNELISCRPLVFVPATAF